MTIDPAARPSEGEANTSEAVVPRTVWQKLGTLYKHTALIWFNVCLLFLLLNILALPLLSTTNREPNPVVARYGEAVYDAFPDLARPQVDRLFNEAYPYPNFQYAPYAQFRELPRRGQYVNVATDGYRVNKPQGPWPLDTAFFNVFVFGGSTTFGYGVADEETIPARIQAHLTVRSQGKPPRVYNFGRGYYFSPQERVLFETLVHQGHIPDLAVFIDGANDIAFWQGHQGQPFFTNTLRSLFTQMGRRGNWSVEMPLTLYLKQRAREQRAREAATAQAVPPPEPEASPRVVLTAHGLPARQGGASTAPGSGAQAVDWPGIVDLYFRNKQMTQALADTFGIETLFVWQPVATYRYDYKAHHVLGDTMPAMAGTAVPYRLVEQRANAAPRDPRLLVLSGIQEHETQNLYVDTVHYNAYFCNAIALRIVHYYLTRLAPSRLAPQFRPAPAGAN